MYRALLLIAIAPWLRAQGDSAQELFEHAVSAQQAGDFESAIREYRQFLKQQPQSVDALANLGAALAHTGHFTEAVTEYTAALKIEPSNAAIRMNLALAFYKAGDFAAASRELESVHQSQPADVRSAILLGDCYQRLGKGEQVIDLLGPLESSQPGNVDLEFVLGSALIRTERRKAGAAMLERVGQTTNSVDAYLIAGSALLDSGDYEGAKRDAVLAAQVNPGFPGVHRLMGLTCDQLSDPQEAEPELRKALIESPEDFQVNLVLGGLLLKQRRLDEAQKYIEHARKLDGSSAMAEYELASLQIATNDLDTAAKHLESVVAKDPNWLIPHVRLSALYFRLHRDEEGRRQKEIVDQLSSEEHEREIGASRK